MPIWHNGGMTLDQWMNEQGVSNAALARQVGVSRPFITRIRSGERQPSIVVAAKLVEATRLPLEAFIKSAA